MKKLLLIFLLLPFFSCTKKNEEQYILQNNEDEPMESSVIQSEELPKSTSSTEPFIEYTIPGVNISFKYPNNERIKNMNIIKESFLFDDNTDLRINSNVYADEFFEHGNRGIFGSIFLSQFEADGNHTSQNNQIKQVALSPENILISQNEKGFYEVERKLSFNNKIIGEEFIHYNDNDFSYEIRIILEGYVVTISCVYYYRDFNELRTLYSDYFTYSEEYDSYSFKSEKKCSDFYNILFNSTDDALPEVVAIFRNTVKSIQESLYVPQYDEVFYEELLKSGFSKNGEYCFIGGHTPQYMFIWTKEKVSGKDDYKLFLFEDKKLVGYYKDIINIPFFANSQVEENKTFIVFNHNLESEDSLWLSGIPESLEFADEEHPLIKVEK